MFLYLLYFYTEEDQVKSKRLCIKLYVMFYLLWLKFNNNLLLVRWPYLLYLFILYITYTGPDALFDAMVNGRARFASARSTIVLDPLSGTMIHIVDLARTRTKL